MAASGVSLTVIIPTRGRRDSLRRTLEGLGPLEGREDVEILVVDNAPEPELRADDVAVRGMGVVRLLHEPRSGKGPALNLALRESVGEIVAVLDDDMEPMPGWADAVIASARSRPAFDIFSGRSHIVWPEGVERPEWSGHWLATGVAFSVIDWGDADREMVDGPTAHPSGNHFWFRRVLVESVAEFPEVWSSDAAYVMTARRHGHRGVFVPGVSCGHRVQPGLMDAGVFLKRVEIYGRWRANFDVVAGGPVVWRLKRRLWWARGLRARLISGVDRTPTMAKARMQWALYDEALRRRRPG